MPRPVLAVAALALVAACGNDPTPGVAVTNSQSDVVFGAGNTPTPAAPAARPRSTFVPVAPGLGTNPFGPSLPPLTFDDPDFEFPEPPREPLRTNICPGPPPFATAPKASTTFVQGQPKEGFHLYQLVRTEDLGDNITSRSVKYTNFQTRNVSKISERANPGGSPTTTFTYDQIAPIGKGQTITTTFQIKQNAVARDVSTGNVGKPARVGEPDAGVAIKKQVLRDAQGKELGKFEPSPAVLILPLPAPQGGDFTGAGTDPTTGGSMNVQGTVIGPQRVITCDGFVQGFGVEATVTSSASQGQDGPSVKQVFVIETQSGGLLIGSTQTAAGSPITNAALIGDATADAAATKIPKDQQP